MDNHTPWYQNGYHISTTLTEMGRHSTRRTSYIRYKNTNVEHNRNAIAPNAMIIPPPLQIISPPHLDRTTLPSSILITPVLPSDQRSTPSATNLSQTPPGASPPRGTRPRAVACRAIAAASQSRGAASRAHAGAAACPGLAGRGTRHRRPPRPATPAGAVSYCRSGA
jgi:hypothetical protein